MQVIKCDDGIEYLKILKENLKCIDSYQYINEKLNIIFESIKDDIKHIEINTTNNDDYDFISIYLFGAYYGINYDFKNYPMLSMNVNKITINELDTIIKINDDEIIIDLFELPLKNFEKIE